MQKTLTFSVLAICLLLGSAPLAFGQDGARTAQSQPAQRSTFDGTQGTFVPQWGDEMQVSLRSDLNELVPAPMFQKASLDDQVVNLPYRDLVLPVDAGNVIQVGQVQADGLEEVNTNDFRKSMQESGVSGSGEWFPAQQVLAGEVERRAGKYFQHIRIYPIQVHSSGNRIRKAASVTYTLRRSRLPQARTSGASNKNYANTSVLANGTWAKIGITSGGIYQIAYEDFSALGIEPSGIDPRTIRVHGNGGGMLPQTAGEFPYDDLVENAIWVSGQGDGSFDPGDFVLFYGQSPHTWDYSERLDRWTHSFNLYSDTTFYFLSYGNGTGKRMPSIASAGGATQTPNYTDKFAFRESDLFNAIGSGRVWLGESFDLTTTRNYNFAVANVRSGTDLMVTARVGARSNSVSNFTVREGGTTLATIPVTNTNTSVYGSYYYRANYRTFNVNNSLASDGNLDLSFTYSKPLTSSIGYMDYLELEYQQSLNIGGNSAWFFNARENTGPGEVFQYNIAGANNNYRVWDITNPVDVREHNFSLNGSTMNFGVACDSVKRFVAFTSNGYKKPVSLKRIANQNLHGLDQAEYIIISYPGFIGAANTLANFHRNHFGRTVQVVNISKIFNEFGSGSKDPTAIRDFLKMFYDRAQQNNSQPLKYTLMMGDGSYDYKGRSNSGGNFIPTYQSRKSQRPTESYTSDDFYGFLDDGEGFWGEKSAQEGGSTDVLFLAEGDTVLNTHGLDIAIGRIPVGSAAEASMMVSKITNYISNPQGFGPWRDKVLLVADHKDEDGQIHISQADSYTDEIEEQAPCMIIDKIFMDNYLMENTASGSRFPEGKRALIQALNEGSLLVNYTGHGGEIGWSNASILDISDINSLENHDRLPACITATCEFGRWDDPSRRSGAEAMFLRENGGSIAMFTTVRVVYSGPNYVLNTNFYDHVFDRDTATNQVLTMGEVFRRTKNDSWLGGINNRNFSLMGDPAMPLAYPDLKAVVTEINGTAVVDTIVDTLSALSKVTITGVVQDANGTFMPNYNGNLFVTVYDKPSRFTTKRSPYNFFWQKNRVFNGQATVSNGTFSFEFVVPIDISYDDGDGKISLYIQNGQEDGNGCNKNIFIGGSDNNSISDDTSPELEIFMNDEKFADGGMVGPDPVLIANIFDENGLNTVGTGIGHELTAILDGDENSVIVLNDFYSALKDSYKEGKIEYPFQDLSDGQHELEVKIWDVANNSASAKVGFVVADDAQMALGHVLNYPNPFTTNTKFYLEHNLNGQPLNVKIKIFTVSGRLVKTLEDSFFADGNLYCDLEWDGLDEYGDALGRGVYVYQVLVQNESSGEKISRFEKLVVLR